MKLSTDYRDRIDLVPIDRDAAREAMILSYLPLVRLIAERVQRRLPHGVDGESLVHSGVVGLLEALDRYDPERGVSFQAYARYRIHGEIVQCLRSLDWASRSIRSWSRRIATARKELAVALCREATSEEVAEALGLSMDTYHRVHCKVNECRRLSFDDLDTVPEDEQVKHCDPYHGNPYEDPLRSVERRDLMQKLQEAIRLLPERERRVVERHHGEELTFREIGKQMGLTEGRICQIYNKACKKLRGALS